MLGATLTFNLAHTIRSVMPDVMTAYPHAKIEVTPHGLLLSPRCRLSRRQQARQRELGGGRHSEEFRCWCCS